MSSLFGNRAGAAAPADSAAKAQVSLGSFFADSHSLELTIIRRHAQQIKQEVGQQLGASCLCSDQLLPNAPVDLTLPPLEQPSPTPRNSSTYVYVAGDSVNRRYPGLTALSASAFLQKMNDKWSVSSAQISWINGG